MNPLTTNISIIQKAVSWFALQINWLVSIWWEHRSLKGRWCDDMNRCKGYEQSILCKYCSGKISFTKLNIFRAKMKNSLTLQLLLQIYWVFVFPCSWPFACPPAWSQIGIYRPSSQFVFTGPGLQFYYQSGAWVLHIATLSSQFVFVFTVLSYDLHYWSGAWIYIYVIIGSSSSGSCNSSSSNFFGIDNTNIYMPILGN